MGAVVDADGVRLFRSAADRLFAWTVLQPLGGDDGQEEVVNQSRLPPLLLPVPTGGNVPPSFHFFSPPVFVVPFGNAHVTQLPVVCVCGWK